MRNSYDTHLYILIFPEKKVIKIGKANDIESRISILRRFWGEVDYQNSYYLPTKESIVFKLEKSLHFLLENKQVLFDYGEGRTELFSLDALDSTLKYLDFYLSENSHINTQVRKGIPEPIACSSYENKKKNQSKHNRKIKSLTKESLKSKQQLKEIFEKYDRSRRIIIFLYARQNIIPFEYEEIEENIIFRVHYRNKNGLSISKSDEDKEQEIFYLFSYSFSRSSGGWNGENFCTKYTKDDGYIEYTLKFTDLGLTGDTHLFNFLIRDIRSALKILPNRSPALVRIAKSSLIEVGKEEILQSIDRKN